jgi:hypothetical protein
MLDVTFSKRPRLVLVVEPAQVRLDYRLDQHGHDQLRRHHHRID